MDKIKYFNATNLVELRREYKILIKKHHPDLQGGDLKKMQEINDQYDNLFSEFKSYYDSNDFENTSQNHFYKGESRGDFENIIVAIEKLLNNYEFNVELVGSWLWAYDHEGRTIIKDTEVLRNELKNLGFKWNPKRKKWNKSPTGGKNRRFFKGNFSEIQQKFGSTTIRASAKKKIAM